MHTKQVVLALSCIPSFRPSYFSRLPQSDAQHHRLNSAHLFSTLPVPCYFVNEKVAPAWDLSSALGPSVLLYLLYQSIQNTVPGSLPGLPDKADHFVSAVLRTQWTRSQQNRPGPRAIRGLVSPHSQVVPTPLTAFPWSGIHMATASEAPSVNLPVSMTLDKVDCCLLWAYPSMQHNLGTHARDSYGHHGALLVPFVPGRPCLA